MFEQLLAISRGINDTSELPAAPEPLLQAVPDDLSLDSIRKLATDPREKNDSSAVLWAIYAALKANKVNVDDDGDDNVKENIALEEISSDIAQIIEPICSGVSFDEDDTDYASLSSNGLLGLHVIRELLALRPQGSLVLPSRTLLSVIAFTNSNDPWTSDSCAELARSLISGYFKFVPPPQAVKLANLSNLRSLRDAGSERKSNEESHKTEQARFITEDIVTGFLRPLFAKSRPATVTASGHPAAFPEPPPRYGQGDGFGGGDDILNTKPWKYTRQYAITVFEWAVENTNTDSLQQHWPLFTPILLTLLDEPQPTSLKLRSLAILRSFWDRCPDGLLSRTGLADVFEQAVFPTVLSLPSLTPETESLALLGAAYPALFDMAGIEGSDLMDADLDIQTTKGEIVDDKAAGNDRGLLSKGFSQAQRRLLDKIVREGIMTGYHHAKEHVQLVNLFCRTLRCLVDGMGILSVKYLKDTIHMISEILIDPFGTQHPPTLLSAILLLQAVLRTCWPRIPHYCNEIIKMTMLAWLNIKDDDSSSTEESTKTELEKHLSRCMEALCAVMTAAKLDMTNRVRPIVAKDPQLRCLFTSCEFD
ncbi:hypothetical protein F4808DRAFT_164754 [Astrocystis sublimbata]|nr:hypothetical protein F4808DRAFT_164754 [Astrocystis sublimbata]